MNFIEFYLKFWCEWMKDVYFFWGYKMSIFLYFKWFSNGMLVYFVEKKERERENILEDWDWSICSLKFVNVMKYKNWCYEIFDR